MYTCDSQPLRVQELLSNKIEQSLSQLKWYLVYIVGCRGVRQLGGLVPVLWQ